MSNGPPGKVGTSSPRLGPFQPGINDLYTYIAIVKEAIANTPPPIPESLLASLKQYEDAIDLYPYGIYGFYTCSPMTVAPGDPIPFQVVNVSGIPIDNGTLNVQLTGRYVLRAWVPANTGTIAVENLDSNTHYSSALVEDGGARLSSYVALTPIPIVRNVRIINSGDTPLVITGTATLHVRYVNYG